MIYITNNDNKCNYNFILSQIELQKMESLPRLVRTIMAMIFPINKYR